MHRWTIPALALNELSLLAAGGGPARVGLVDLDGRVTEYLPPFEPDAEPSGAAAN